MAKERKIKIGCEVFIIKNNELLLGLRKNCFGEGMWGLPGGHLEEGEKLIDAARRELKEELSIRNQDLELITITDDVKGSDHYIHISFEIKDFQGSLKLMEEDKCEEWKYFNLNKLPKNIFLPHRRIIKTYKKGKTYLY